MADHFDEKHPSTPMPEELAKAVALKYHEKDTTLELLKVYPRSIKVATNCLGKDCPCTSTTFNYYTRKQFLERP